MWLVACFPTDAAALWAASGLARRGMQPLVLVSPEALVCSRSLVHEITNGRGRTTFTLPDNRKIDSADVRGTLNRVTALPAAHLMGASLDDRHYAEHELHAVVLSVLHALGDRVLNRPTPQGLAGRVRHTAEWLRLAGRAGLQTAGYVESDRDPRGPQLSRPPAGARRRLLVLDDRVYGDAVPADIGEKAIALARLADTRLLGVEAIESPGGAWWFADASATSDLRVGGEPFLDALADALGSAPGRAD